MSKITLRSVPAVQDEGMGWAFVVLVRWPRRVREPEARLLEHEKSPAPRDVAVLNARAERWAELEEA